MAKKQLKSKAAKGIAYGDVANAMVRNLLTLLSKQIGEITEEEIKKTIKYFDKKCPYTGKELPINNVDDIKEEEYKKLQESFQMDHIIPQNRIDCGLNIYGNLVYVDKTANSQKGGKSVEEFIKNNKTVDGLKDATIEERNKRLAKIKEFQETSGYQKYVNKTIELSAYLENKYKAVTDEQNTKLRELAAILGPDYENSEARSCRLAEGEKDINLEGKKKKNVAAAVFVDFLDKSFKSMPASTLSCLCDKRYCSEKLKICFPVLTENVPGTFPADRYYKDLLFIKNGKAYRLTSQFTPRRNHKQILEEWIKKYNQEIGS